MTSNVFTKKDILQNLASRGCFIDIYTLEAFFAKKKIEAIFEDSQGNEFYDNNALNLVLEGLFNSSQALKKAMEEPEQNPANTNIQSKNTDATDIETQNIINNITLSDGTALKDKLGNVENLNLDANNIQNNFAQEQTQVNTAQTMPQIENTPTAQPSPFDEFNSVNQINPVTEENKPSLDDANDMLFQSDGSFDTSQNDIMSSELASLENGGNYDDISLLSESLEAQEKFRQYVMSEFSRNNIDNTQQRMQSGNEFKLDISERTLNMIARTMAKKIAKYVGSIMAQDAKQSSKVAEYEEENRKLTQKARELEEQNRKLRLLLAESNKNLNSYKPSIFGLYKKIDPNVKKK